MEFRTRKAHRWVVRDKDLLKYLLGMVLIMLAYLAAWTATNLNFLKEGFSLLTIGYTDSGLHFRACKPLWWDYVTEAGQFQLQSNKYTCYNNCFVVDTLEHLMMYSWFVGSYLLSRNES